jgi:hypothetical protein|tara:strand:- start:1029 stop:1445 length:417 start_codon:yes stop_codon:yes gene_type:complete
MRQWFVTPEEVTLPLFDDGECWITVRKQLTAGEEKRLSTSALKRMSPTGAGTDDFAVAYDVDFEAAAFNKILVYLLDWNVPTANGKVAVIETPKAMAAALRAMHPSVFAEIERVIDEHVQENVEKKATSGPTGADTTS